TVRIRWILTALLLVFSLPAAIKNFSPLLLVVTIMLAANFFAARLIKRGHSQTAGGWIGTFYALTDSCALYLYFHAYHPNQVLQILLAGLGVHLAIQLNAVLPLLIFFLGLGMPSNPPVMIFLTIAFGSYWLT